MRISNNSNYYSKMFLRIVLMIKIIVILVVRIIDFWVVDFLVFFGWVYVIFFIIFWFLYENE